MSAAIVTYPVRLQSFNDILRQQPKRCRAFAYHAKKNQNNLGYKSVLHFLLSQYLFHLRSFKHNIITQRKARTVLSIYAFLIGIPLAAFFFILYHPTIQEQS